MAVYSGPKVVTDGMVLHLDKYNEESYLGEPTTNILGNPSIASGTSLLSGWSFTNYTTGMSISSGHPDPFGKNNAVLWEYDGSMPHTSDYPAVDYNWNPNNTNTHTFSLWTKNAYNTPTGMYLYTYAWNPGWAAAWGSTFSNLLGGTYGITNEWQLAWTSGSPLNTGSHRSRIIHNTSNSPNPFGIYLYGPQMEEKARATKFVDGTRSATNGWQDLSGNDNHGNITDLTYSATKVPGTNVNDFSFNGSTSGNEITVPSSSSVELTSELTAEVWMNWESGHGRLFQKDTSTNSSHRLWEMGIYNSNFRMEMWHSNGSGTTQYSPNTLTANTWYHLLMTFDGINIKMYENSVLVKTISRPGDIRSSSSRDITIGGSWGTSEYHDGLISDVKLYNRALSAIEVLQNFNASKGRYGL